MIQEKPLHTKRFTAWYLWCGLWAGGIISPYFLENDAKQAVTVNDVRYSNMLRMFLWPQLDGMDIEAFLRDFNRTGWWNYHTAYKTIDLLPERFPGRIISHNGDRNWPPRSYDLRLWGYVKSGDYANNPRRIPELRTEIRCVIGEIEPQLYAKVMEIFVKRAKACQQSGEGHLFVIVFYRSVSTFYWNKNFILFKHALHSIVFCIFLKYKYIDETFFLLFVYVTDELGYQLHM